MKKLGLLICFVFLVGCCSGCATRIGVGELGLKVNLYGTKKGVDNVQVKTGMVWFNPFTTDVEKIKTSVQRVVFSKGGEEGFDTDKEISFMSKDGLRIAGDFAVEYSIDSDRLREFYIKYKSQINNSSLQEFSNKIIRDRLRDIVNKKSETLTVDEIISGGKKILGEHALNQLREIMKVDGIIVNRVSVMNNWYLPDQVVDAINAKVQATQKAIEAENRVQEARALAQANAIQTQTLTAQVLEQQRLELMRKAIEKWNGVLPTSMIPNQSLPFIGVK